MLGGFSELHHRPHASSTHATTYLPCVGGRPLYLPAPRDLPLVDTAVRSDVPQPIGVYLMSQEVGMQI
jgi:hypothetical protein